MCVSWFRLQYPDIGKLLFAVPNGGARGRTEAAIMKAEGVTAGVTDLILLLGRGGFNALCIEMKTPDRRSVLSDAQIERRLPDDRGIPVGNTLVFNHVTQQP